METRHLSLIALHRPTALAFTGFNNDLNRHTSGGMGDAGAAADLSKVGQSHYFSVKR